MSRFQAPGFGFHWPDLDEDIGVEGLLLGKHSVESPESFERWLQKRQQPRKMIVAKEKLVSLVV